MDHRIGHGYDLHRLEPLGSGPKVRPLVVGGVRLEHTAGPVAHSTPPPLREGARGRATALMRRSRRGLSRLSWLAPWAEPSPIIPLTKWAKGTS